MGGAGCRWVGLSIIEYKPRDPTKLDHNVHYLSNTPFCIHVNMLRQSPTVIYDISLVYLRVIYVCALSESHVYTSHYHGLLHTPHNNRTLSYINFRLHNIILESIGTS